MTKFSIVIGSSRAYLSRDRRAMTWVSNYRCPIWTFCNRTPVIGYPPTKLRKSPTDVSAQKKFSFRNLLWIRLISNWTSCRTIQGVIGLVISNRPRVSRSSDFEITRAITPWIVLHSIQLLLLIARVISKSDKREVWGQFEVTSTITLWIVRHEMQLLIKCLYNKFWNWKCLGKFFWAKISVAFFKIVEKCVTHFEKKGIKGRVIDV